MERDTLVRFSKQTIKPGKLTKQFSAHILKCGRAGLVRSIMNRDPSALGLTKQSDLKVISNRLGWVDIAEQMRADKARFEQFVSSIQADGIRHLLVLGMGGSSLAPEMFSSIFGNKSFLKSFQIVDTTSPDAIKNIDHDIDFTKAVLIVASKSGTTVETISQFRHFFKIVKEKRPLKVGRFFTAITDQGSALYNIGQRNRFREMFINRSDIGGRYSALSYFGIVPSLFTKIKTDQFLENGSAFSDLMRNGDDSCDALQLGVMLGLAAKAGFDKVKFFASPRLKPFIAWLEQLIAESTGKGGVGILPVDDDFDYNGGCRSDWVVVNLNTPGERIKQSNNSAKSIKSDNPIINIPLLDLNCLASEILKWEMATVIASSILGVNPLDEPNVTESKSNSMTILTAKKKRGCHGKKIPEPILVKGNVDFISVSDGGLDLRRDRGKSQKEILQIFLNRIAKKDYLAILAYVERNDKVEKKMAQLRSLITERYDLTVIRGYGPRYLHSTGQLFKGGPQVGHFLVLEQAFTASIEIPGADFDFTQLIRAQAKGDIKAIQKRKRPMINIMLNADPSVGVGHIINLI